MKIALVNLINATCDTPDSLCGLIGLSFKKKMKNDFESSIVELGISFANYGHEVTIFISDNYKPEKSLIYDNLKIEYLPTKLKSIFPPAFIPFTPSLYKKLRESNFDIIQSSDYFQIGTIISVIASLNKKTDVFVWQDLNNFPRFPGGLIIKLFCYSFGRLFQKRIKLLIPKSNSSCIFLNRCKVKGNKIYDVVPTGVDTNIFKPKMKLNQIFNIDRNKRVILCVARLHKQKGLEYLIKAMKIVTNNIPDVVLVIKGNGELLTDLQDLIDNLGLSENVYIHESFIERDLLVDLYNYSEFTVLPSVFETFGFVILESMACGKPVIATNINGPAEIISNKNVGYLVTPMSSEDLAEKIISLLYDNHLKEKMGLNARNLVLQKYSWSIISTKFIEVYKSWKEE